MADLPEFLTDQTETAIRQRMLEALPSDLDKSEGGFLWDAIAPAAIELALAAIWAQQVLERSFAQTTFGAYLDLRAEEHGIFRRVAVAATVTLTFGGTPGTVIAAGTQASTPSTDAVPAVVFSTDAEATIGAGGTVDVAATAVEAGARGNVAAGTVTLLVAPIAGVSGVTNAAPASGGLDEETDAELLSRYLQKVRSPSAGGNRADYVNWALEVPGVGGVSVVPVRDGPGTVSVAIIDSNKQPASQALVDAVQDSIAPPHRLPVEAEAMTIGGSGVSVVDDPEASGGQVVQMVFDAGGAGTLAHQDLDSLLPQPGIWQARVVAKVDADSGTDDLLEIGVWNVSANDWAQTTPSGGTDARQVLQADELGTSFGEVLQQFAWNGQDQLELRITRLQTDTVTTVWLDQVVYRSTFSRDDGEGRAPIGARVTVEAAVPISINVSATLTIASGFDGGSVRTQVEANIDAYLKSLAFTDDNDVRYVRIGNAILDTPGVADYANLTVNGGTANVPVGPQQVAVKGTVTLT